jgi:hypothetical protein
MPTSHGCGVVQMWQVCGESYSAWSEHGGQVCAVQRLCGCQRMLDGQLKATNTGADLQLSPAWLFANREACSAWRRSSCNAGSRRAHMRSEGGSQSRIRLNPSVPANALGCLLLLYRLEQPGQQREANEQDRRNDRVINVHPVDDEGSLRPCDCVCPDGKGKRANRQVKRLRLL